MNRTTNSANRINVVTPAAANDSVPTNAPAATLGVATKHRAAMTANVTASVARVWTALFRLRFLPPPPITCATRTADATAGEAGAGVGVAATFSGTLTHWTPFHHHLPSGEYWPWAAGGTESAVDKGDAAEASTSLPQAMQKRAPALISSPQAGQ